MKVQVLSSLKSTTTPKIRSWTEFFFVTKIQCFIHSLLVACGYIGSVRHSKSLSQCSLCFWGVEIPTSVLMQGKYNSKSSEGGEWGGGLKYPSPFWLATRLNKHVYT